MADIFPDDIFKCILLNENVWILIKISSKFVLKVRINHISSLVPMISRRHFQMHFIEWKSMNFD